MPRSRKTVTKPKPITSKNNHHNFLTLLKQMLDNATDKEMNFIMNIANEVLLLKKLPKRIKPETDAQKKKFVIESVPSLSVNDMLGSLDVMSEKTIPLLGFLIDNIEDKTTEQKDNYKTRVVMINETIKYHICKKVKAEKKFDTYNPEKLIRDEKIFTELVEYCGMEKKEFDTNYAENLWISKLWVKKSILITYLIKEGFKNVNHLVWWTDVNINAKLKKFAPHLNSITFDINEGLNFYTTNFEEFLDFWNNGCKVYVLDGDIEIDVDEYFDGCIICCGTMTMTMTMMMTMTTKRKRKNILQKKRRRNKKFPFYFIFEMKCTLLRGVDDSVDMVLDSL